MRTTYGTQERAEAELTCTSDASYNARTVGRENNLIQYFDIPSPAKPLISNRTDEG